MRFARAVLVLSVWGLGSYLWAQDKPQLLIGVSLDKTAAVPRNRLAMRPNIEQPFYFFVKNPTNKDGKFTVLVGEQRAEMSVEKGETKLVKFGKPMPPPAAATAATAPPPVADAKPVWVDLKSAPPTLLVQLLQIVDDKPQELESKELAFDLLVPQAYVDDPIVTFASEEPGKNQLTVKVKSKPKDKFSGPPCTVQLLLTPELAGGLLQPVSRDADFQGVLTRPEDEVTLFAKDLRFKPATPPKGQIYLTVDGYERAFIFDFDFNQLSAPIKPREAGEKYRVLAPRTAPAGAKIPVRVEVDYSSKSDEPLELALGKEDGGQFQIKAIKELQGSREKKVHFRPGGPDGSLVFQTEVKDWVTEVDTAGVLGVRTLRVRLKDAGEKPIEGKATIVIDSTAPEEVQIVDAPATALQGAYVNFKATGKDPESGIEEVVFFLGKPPADGKLPPTLDTYKAAIGEKDHWSAKVPMPSDRKGPTLVSVQFVNAAGMTTFASATVTILDPAAPKPPLPPGKIEGTLLEGDRPQPKLDVSLLDAKGTEVGKTKTKDDGTFAFDDVAPGSYKVTAVKTASVTKAEQAVAVKSGETAKVEAKLFR
jgi:hypothetical protein